VNNKELQSPTKRKTRENIIKTSKQLFAEFGIENTTIIQISLKCNLTRRTIYDYFPSKKEIIYEILVDYFNELYDIDFSLFHEGNELDRLKKLLHLIFDRYLDNQIIMRFLVDYYQLNPRKPKEEDEMLKKSVKLKDIHTYISYHKLGKETYDYYKNNTEIIVQFMLGIGMRYSLRNNLFLGLDHSIDRKDLHNSLKLLMQSLE